VKYLPGVENLLPDALSRMYAFDAPGTVRTPSEYVQHDMDNDFTRTAHLASMPMIVGEEALATHPRRGGRVAALATSPRPDAPRASGPDLRRSVRIAQRAVEPIVAAAPYALGTDSMGKTALRQGVLPLPSGQGAEPTPPRTRRARAEVAPAETGRPETAAEFSRCMRDHFVLLGPGERKKGGGKREHLSPRT